MKKFAILIAISGVALCPVLSQKPDNYEVYAIKYATLAGPTPLSQWVSNVPAKDSVDIIFMFWLIKGDNGKNILVDAGCHRELPSAIDFGITNYSRPDSLLQELGLEPADITDIIITHPHWDHVNGIDLFPAAQLWMQKEDFNYYVGMAWQKEGKHGGVVKDDMLYLARRNMEGKVNLVDGDNREIFPGISVYTGSRHTYNSQYVGVSSGANRIIIASDNIWVYDNLDKLLPPPSYGTFDPAGYVKAMQRMKTQASKASFILPGHDAKMFSRFSAVSRNVVRIL